MSRIVISLEHVSKSFGALKVIDDLRLQIKQGQIVALLGVNGAGKTTTLNMILGLEKADSGTVLLDGLAPNNPFARKRIGVTAQNSDFPQGLKVRELIEFVAKHYDAPANIDEILAQFNLTDHQLRLSNVLSGGQKRRLALALAFVGNPEIIFLDEPTTGLDIQSRQQVWEQIRGCVQAGCTIVLTTHYIEEAEALADRVVILHQGKIRADGSVAEIKRLATVAKVCFQCTSKPELSNELAVDISFEHGRCIIYTKRPDDVVRALVHNDVDFTELEVIRTSLEDAFLQVSQAPGSEA